MAQEMFPVFATGLTLGSEFAALASAWPHAILIP